jgi:peptidyl-prolyl cis-trans isomerase A (cyclophilin A)
LPGFVAQFGASAYPAVQRAWDAAPIRDDSVVMSNMRGTLTFAKPGQPDSRTTQLFINYGDNTSLDALGFAPIGRVVSGMGSLLRLYSGYGELPPDGNAPYYGCMLEGGDAYLRERYPRLDRIESAAIIERPGVTARLAPQRAVQAITHDHGGSVGLRALEGRRAAGVY